VQVVIFLATTQWRVFAAVHIPSLLNIEVIWPGGARTVVTNATPNFVYQVIETGDSSSATLSANLSEAQKEPALSRRPSTGFDFFGM
jgi:hypothetical protein